jgi:Mn2+/Fe2+ NRAMP family transporter
MTPPEKRPNRPRLLSMIGPGILVAATGVGAGDLSGAGFAGSQLGVAVLWAVLVGAVFSSLLGVWQSAPYLFADIWRLFY